METERGAESHKLHDAKLQAKSQLISKFLFDIFNSSKNMNKKIRPNNYGTSCRIVFFRFLEELKTTKRHFEIK